jgi:predicted permease
LIRRGASIDMPNAFGLIPMVRLRPGHSLSQATDVLRRQAEIVGPASRLPPSLAQPFGLVPASSGTSAAGAGMSGLRQQYGQPLLVLLTIAAALLASACITVATLLLIRGSGRARELSVRLALGASRARLATQLLTESLLLGLIAAAAAVPLAHWMTRAVSHQISAIEPSAALNGSLGWRAGVPITIAAIGVVLCTGLVPALFTVRGARTNPAAPHAHGPQASQPRLVNALVVAQVAVCLVLLVAAGLLVRTVVSLTSVPFGFDPKAVLLVSADTSRVPLGDGSRLAIYQRMIASVNGAPGVASAAGSSSIPLSGGFGRLRVNRPAAPAAQVTTLFNFVSPGGFATYGTVLVGGRDFDTRDTATGTPVAVINETLARRLFADEDAVGQSIAGGPDGWPPRVVVGVVRDAVSHVDRAGSRSSQALREPAAASLYLPLAQAEGLMPPDMTRITIGVRAVDGAPQDLAPGIAAVLAESDPLVSYSFRPLADVVGAAFAQERTASWLASACGLLALVLAAGGLYGVSAYAVTLRRGEIGIRMALGATPGAAIRLILGRIAFLTALGAAEGAVLSLWAGDSIAALLFGVSATDPFVLVLATATVVTVGLASGFVPARRAALIDPVETLRS